MDIYEQIEAFFRPKGALAKHFPAYEFRPEQLTMAQSVAESFESGKKIIVEAGTGTGKSLAYLVPAVIWSTSNRKRVLISTHTKTLQEQLLNHDIPLLNKTLELPFRHALCMGNENYLSLRRLGRAGQTGLFQNSQEEQELGEIFNWAAQTKSGIKSEIDFEPLYTVWDEVGRKKDLCLGKNCPTYKDCFYFKERKAWYHSHLLIVNHHLFFANVANQGAVLPRFDAVIFDEAQNLEDSATHFLGLTISNVSLYFFLDRLFNARNKRGKLTNLPDSLCFEARQKTLTARRMAEAFFENLFERFGRNNRTLRFYRPPEINNLLFTPLSELYDALKTLEGHLDNPDEVLEVGAAATRCQEFSVTLSSLLNQSMDSYVYWLEVSEKKRQPRATLRGVPVHVQTSMKKEVFDKVDRTVLTSATLTTKNDFEYINERLGFEPEKSFILDSPFDYPKQALLYLPEDLPGPSEDFTDYINAISKRVEELIHVTKGKTFVLFTSYDILNRVHAKLDPEFKDLKLFKQGSLSTTRMIERFKKEPSVIFGTQSFWQGVDIAGDALTSVIITKLPFDVPSDPLIEARLEDLKKQNINPFRHFQIPRAIIHLRQGFGRLIRSQNDRGIVSILDSRIVNKGYGKDFIESLPKSEVTHKLSRVKDFYTKIENLATKNLASTTPS